MCVYEDVIYYIHCKLLYYMSHHHDIYCNSDPPYSFFYYAYKSKLYFLRNAIMMIFCSFVKIITTQTYAHKYTKIIVAAHRPHTSRRQPQINRAAHVSSYTHILNITYTNTHNDTQI